MADGEPELICAPDAAWLDAYADGALAPPAAAEAEAHLSGCPSCRAALEEIRATKKLLRHSREEQPAPPQALAQLLGMLRAEPWPPPPLELAESRATEPVRASRRAWWRAPALRAAAAVVLAVGLGLWGSIRWGLLGAPAGVSLAYAPGVFAHFQHREIAFAPQLPASPPPVPDLGNVQGGPQAAAPLAPPARQALLAQALLAQRTHALEALEVYRLAASREEAVLWTSDLALAAFARTLARVREALLAELVAPQLEALLDELLVALERMPLPKGAAELAAARTLARNYCAIGRALLGGQEAALAARAGGALAAELRRIEAARGIATSPLSGLPVDYAAFPPPDGTPQRRLERALLWLGTGRLPLDRPEGARAALVLLHALLAAPDGGSIARYERVRAVLDFFYGEPDGWTPARLVPWLRAHWGPRLVLAELGAGARSERLLGLLAGLPGPSIPGPEGAGRPLASLLGQRYGLEAEVAAALSWPHVGTPERPRLLPGGLDVLAVLGVAGAEQAVAVRDAPGYEGYERALAALRERLAPVRARRDRHRGEDLVWLLAYALEGLEPLAGGAGYPRYARGEAARLRRLNTALAAIAPEAYLGEPRPPEAGLLARGTSTRTAAERAAAELDALEPLQEAVAAAKAELARAEVAPEPSPPGPAPLPGAPPAEPASTEAGIVMGQGAEQPRPQRTTGDGAAAVARRLGGAPVEDAAPQAGTAGTLAASVAAGEEPPSEGDRAGRPAAPGPAAAVLVDPCPEWFARLASIARAVAAGLEELQPAMPSRPELLGELRALAAALERLAAAARLQLEGRALPAELVAELGDPAPFCERFLPGPTLGLKVLAVVAAAQTERPQRVAVRAIAGFDQLLVLAPAPPGSPRPLVLGRGALLRVRETVLERRPQPLEALALARLGPPAWLAPLYGEDAVLLERVREGR
ncbi:MAG: hypothetical protein KatS3mg102_2307 [Planctomycetota bacterium]|nr:MAG: hypothetical protein KatS3mg102_2307 [Planctomycetota bacterium]